MTNLPENTKVIVRSGGFNPQNASNSQPVEQIHLTDKYAGDLFAEISLESDLQNFITNNDNIGQVKISPPKN